jgi:4-oxalocrotonate tautomerase
VSFNVNHAVLACERACDDIRNARFARCSRSTLDDLPKVPSGVTRWFTRQAGIFASDSSSTNRGEVMPFVNVKLIEGVFTPEQKRDMIHRLTETMVEIEGENLRQVTWVVVEEVKSGDWGIGGNGLTTADVHALQGRSAAAVRG